MPRKISLVGQRFGKLKVIADAPSYLAPHSGHLYAMSVCLCDCGKTTTVRNSNLRKKPKFLPTRSCGCLQKVSMVIHGYAGTKTHTAWCAMKKRCYCGPNSPLYARYAGRGIKVCDRWRESFANFLEDMGEAPANKTLDRIDNDGDYEPGNCRWADMMTQGGNRSNNKRVTAFGVTGTASEMARRFGVPLKRFYERLKLGWSVEQALTIPKLSVHLASHTAR